MSPGFICIAGIDASGRTIRPQYRAHRITDDWLNKDKPFIKQFTRVSMDLEAPRPKAPHTEDWIVKDEPLKFLGDCSIKEKQEILESSCFKDVSSIFDVDINQVDGQGTFIQTGSGSRSLGTVSIPQVFEFKHRNYEGHWDYRLNFVDQSGSDYRLKVVDLSFQTFIDHIRICHKASIKKIESFSLKQIFSNRQIFLRIGLARGWANYPERCYLQITGVYTFPDYLDHHCFQEYQSEIDATIP
jgi:hypothetical protein